MADSANFTLPTRNNDQTQYTNQLPSGLSSFYKMPYADLGSQLADAFGISSGRGMYVNDRYSNILNNLSSMRGWGFQLPGMPAGNGGAPNPALGGGLLNMQQSQQAPQQQTAQPAQQSPVTQQSGLPDWAKRAGGGIDPATGRPSWGSAPMAQTAQPQAQSDNGLSTIQRLLASILHPAAR